MAKRKDEGEDTRTELVEGTKPFAHFLEMLDDGAFHWELSEALRDLCGTLSQTAADGGIPKGKIVVTFDLKMSRKNLEVAPKFTVKKPEKPLAKSFLWLTPGNNPTPENPRQERFRFGPRAVADGPVREVTEESRTVREV